MNSQPVLESLSTISVVDALVVIALLIGLARGIMRGLSGELAGLLSAAAALAAGWYGFRPLGAFIESSTRLTGQPAYTLAFAITVIAGYLLMRVLRLVLRAILEFSFKGSIERIGGAIGGLLHCALFVAVALIFLSLWPAEPLHRWITEQSYSGRFVMERLRPWYDKLTERYPDLPLPKPHEPATESPDKNQAAPYSAE